MGISLKDFVFCQREIPKDQTINLLSVGRLVDMKGRKYAIQAVIRILQDYQNVTYHLVGDGPLRKELQDLIDTHHAQDSITLHGWTNSKNLKDLYDSSHIFLHPSVRANDGNMEGQGVVLVEAQAHGLPIIATQHGAFPETVLDGQSAFLVPEKDVDALVDKLAYLIDNPQIWPEMGRRGRAFVEKHFDSETLNRRLVEIYQSLL